MNYSDRLEQDYKDICAKKGALAHFLEFGNHTNLDIDMEGLLRIQYSILESYHNVLLQRKKLVAKGFSNSKGEVMEEGKTVAELYAEYKNGMRDL
jgi:hypothetical protein